MPGRFYIAPNSTIVLLRDVPIDQAQEHTLWFPDANTQANYFIGRNGVTLSQQYYVRQGRGVIKVEATADLIYNCNYLMYKNTNFGNKWFYAFITSIEYTNNNTATITFVIDQMQTWFFEMQLGQSFVVREHSSTDILGDNLIPEGLETGEFLYYQQSKVPELDNLCIVIASSEFKDLDDTFKPFPGQMRSGLYCGVGYTAFAITDAGVAAANDWLADLTEDGKSDAVVSVFMAPVSIVQNNTAQPTVINYSYLARPSTIDGYTPHNNKLFTAPYMSIFVKTPTNAAEYAWEYFKGSALPQFVLTGNTSTSPAIMMIPVNYKTVTNDNSTTNYRESLTLNGYPQCAYTIDTYKAWLAQNGPSLRVNGLLAAISYGFSVASGNMGEYNEAGMYYPWTNKGTKTATEKMQGPPEYLGSAPESSVNATGVIGSAGVIANILLQTLQHSILPPHAMGNADGCISLANGTMNFIFYTKTIRREYAEIIDQYFDKFGYATHKVKVPNIHARTLWTYTKTVDCIVHGNLPTEAITEIQNIFNRGVTFWVNPDNVGRYDLAAQNTPLGGA